MEKRAWHVLSKEDIEKVLLTSFSKGLSRGEVYRRLEKYGLNELKERGRKTVFQMFLEQFKDFMIVVLIAAAIVSGLLGEITDAFIILLIVVLNAILGVVQESKAEKALEALKKMASPTAKVVRDGMPDVVPASQLVPGDVVVLEAGDFVPADIRLLETSNLKIEEAALTGESVPVEKFSGKLEKEDVPLGDRVNMAYAGSIVTYGRGKGIVVSTGMDTEMGKIAEMIQTGEETVTPLQKRMELVGKTLGTAALAICGVIFIVGILYGKEIFQMFLTSVSLAVAAIPEGLPAIVTIVLAVGVQRMARRNAIIRKLPAVETLGSATIICSDKTGTLTQNRMAVQQVCYGNRIINVGDIEGQKELDDHLNLLITTGVLCNDTQVIMEGDNKKTIGDPTETALVHLGFKVGLDKDILDANMPRVDELPFDSDRKLMTTIHKLGDGYRVFTKGAPDRLILRCNRILLDGRIVDFSDELRQAIHKANDEMASQALRVLGMAYKDMENLNYADKEKDLENGLIFVGLVGMIDPPRPEAKEAIKICRKAGIKPVMITGDHKVTAVAIARQLGILERDEEAITGVELDQMSDEEFKDRVRKISVYARVSPEHKVRIVKAWQAWGEIVAMTGDGVNDAPALKMADIGAAMGQVGTDVAKGAADMVLTDDNFATIVAAVEEGRIIFANILKAIQYLLSCNVGEILVIFIATMLNWEEPLLPIHILWINLVTDSFPALALGMEPAERDIMDKKPRDPKTRIFSRGMVRRIVYQGFLTGILTLTAFTIGLKDGLDVGRTMAFAALTFGELVHVFNVRSNKYSIFRIGFLTNRYVVGAVVVSALLQISVMVVPFLSDVFNVAPLSLRQWMWVVVLALARLAVVEIVKLLGYNTTKDEE
ncbi:Ca2+-transporting ATPase [Caldicoprobacter guelmensis]|uniref:calcium-translocating P-type ATPase, SERCA-type n=1 Tax=Caldicoprobacter guelmensis TaxID=1170224 RepID=UPI0019568460|nr:calcium-translocating P-type ATPase, SERCA-type [Caldicoprobacter guelmensis]MBM7581923.1 Ca2+-transporting ATPase [Caldicoprobacter guelmensis]